MSRSPIKFLQLIIYIFSTVSLISCGGGGGSSGMTRTTTTNTVDTTTTATTPDTTTTTTPAALLATDPADFAAQKTLFETSSEYDVRYLRGPSFQVSFIATTDSDTHLNRINAAAAYARGATGAGETVAVIDSGLLQTHQEFQRAGKITTSLFPGDTSTAIAFHGTAVSAIAVGERDGTGAGMHGVAFEANLHFVSLPPTRLVPASPEYNPIDISLITTADDRARSQLYGHGILNNLAPIINHSFGINGAISRYDPDAVRNRFEQTAMVLAQAGTDDADKNILIWAAGNAGGRLLASGETADTDSPEISSGLGVVFPELRSHVLTVVALDQDGEIADYSNHCGIAKSFCLAAPGSAIVTASYNGDTDYAYGYGTSFAAPIVSGALAVLRHFFRNDDGSYQLGNTELVARLLATSDKTGVYADSDTYGQGLVDLDAATRPVGAIMLGLPSDPDSRPLADSRIAVSGTAFGALQQALAGVTVTGFDALGAPFPQSNTAWINTPLQTSGITRHKTVSAALPTSPYRNHDDWHLSLSVYNDNPIADMQLTNKDWWVSYGHHGGQSLGLYHQPSSRFVAQGFNDPIAFTAPYMSLVRSGPGLGWINSISGGGNIGLTLMHGTPRFDNQYRVDGEQGTGILLDYQLVNSGLSLQTGAVYEPEGFLGARLQGAFGNAHATTWFVGVNSSWAFGDKRNWHLLGSAYLGHTRPQLGHSGLLRDTDAIVSSAFALGAAGTSIWKQNDWFGVRIWQPLRAERGDAKLRVPIGRTKYGQVLHQDHQVSLTPTGRNLKMETSYRLPITYGELQTSVGVERHPQHDSRHNIKPFLQLYFERRFNGF